MAIKGEKKKKDDNAQGPHPWDLSLPFGQGLGHWYPIRLHVTQDPARQPTSVAPARLAESEMAVRPLCLPKAETLACSTTFCLCFPLPSWACWHSLSCNGHPCSQNIICKYGNLCTSPTLLISLELFIKISLAFPARRGSASCSTCRQALPAR